MPIQEEADPGQIRVEAPTLLVTPEHPSTLGGNCMSPLSIEGPGGRQEGRGGTGEYHSRCMCLSNSNSINIANTIMMAIPGSSMAVITSKGTLPGAGAGLGGGTLVPGAEAITERLCVCIIAKHHAADGQVSCVLS